MTTHIVCLDGTNQTKSQQHPTNIAKIFDSIGGHPTDAGNGSWETKIEAGGGGAVVSLGKYLPGVGSQGNAVLKVLGNAFGDGIAEPIIRGYTFLSRAFAAGDKIIITGFSRGATAARALAGFVAVRGLLNRSRYNVNDKDAAYMRAISAWYAYRAGRPDFANQERLEWIQRRLDGGLPGLTNADYTAPLQIAAVGVFDTVSSLGLPHLDWNGNAVFDFSICDTTLNANVQRGFHALAADETRDLFSPTYWAERAGIVQEIFPGSHSNVGGGYPERGLSDGALEWMLANLETAGLVCDRSKIKPMIGINPFDPARDDALIFPFKATPLRSRAFPGCARASALLTQRWNRPVEILPGDGKPLYKAKGTYADGRAIL